MGIVAGRHTLVPEDVECFVQLRFGAFCSIASGLKIISGQHPGVGAPNAISDFPFSEHGFGKYPASEHDGKVVVGSDVWIGQDVSIMAGVVVGHGARIGAGAMVVKDVPHYAVVVGNPGEIKRFRFDAWQIDKLVEIAWWRWSDREIKDQLFEFANVDTFLHGK
jgi:chloramphenicol O-acetyltransferase type B